MLFWVEENCGITLKQIKENIMNNFRKLVSISTVDNYLEGRFFTTKKLYFESITMNSEINKLKRSEYVQSLNDYIQQG